MEPVLAAIAGSDLAAFLKGSRYVYPLVNAAHVLGIALLVGTIAVVDARFLGVGAGTAAGAARLLLPFTVAGFLLAVVAGFALFSVRPFEYAANPVFRAKLLLIALALANVAAMRLLPGWRRLRDGAEAGTAVRLLAALSLLLWVGVLLAGRMIAFAG